MFRARPFVGVITTPTGCRLIREKLGNCCGASLTARWHRIGTINSADFPPPVAVHRRTSRPSRIRRIGSTWGNDRFDGLCSLSWVPRSRFRHRAAIKRVEAAARDERRAVTAVEDASESTATGLRNRSVGQQPKPFFFLSGSYYAF